MPKDFVPDFLTLHAQIEPSVCGIAPYPGEHFRVHLGTQGFEVAHFAISPWDEFRIHQAALRKALSHNLLERWRKAQAPHTHIRHISWWYSVKNLGHKRLVICLPARVIEQGIKVQPDLVARGTTALCRPQPRRQGGRFVFLTLHDRLWIDRPGDHDFAVRLKIE